MTYKSAFYVIRNIINIPQVYRAWVNNEFPYPYNIENVELWLYLSLAHTKKNLENTSSA